jgi:hypothetical protein
VAEGLEKGLPRLRATRDDADDLEAVERLIGLGMGGAHVAAADDEDPQREGHGGDSFGKGL